MIFICIGLIAVIVLSAVNVIDITKKIWIAIWTLIIPHSILAIVYVYTTVEKPVINGLFFVLLLGLAHFYLIKFNMFPIRKKRTQDNRLNILMGGRTLLLTAIYVTLVQAVVFVFAFKYRESLPFSQYWLIVDLVVNICFAAILYLNGFWRIAILSRRMNIIKKVVFGLLMWVPIVNIILLLRMCKAVTDEYQHETYKMNQNEWRVESQICQTKYPLIMLHGVGFRDLKYFNYWGRIPKELIKNGATVYYGNQEGWGTIESNADDVKKKILEISEETGAEKVNIIAHSKGGLDARYMISKLGMEDYVASLTMMSTPNRGSFIVDFTKKLPQKLVAFIGKMINRSFKMMGDKDPDFDTALKQFYTESAEEFNKEVVDSDKVYYQSYMSLMSSALSDYILFMPHLIGGASKTKSDGLVTVQSAMWGEYKGTMETKRFRGISHGDMIDLRRNDYKGFDVREFYVNIVSELKEKGF